MLGDLLPSPAAPRIFVGLYPSNDFPCSLSPEVRTTAGVRTQTECEGSRGQHYNQTRGATPRTPDGRVVVAIVDSFTSAVSVRQPIGGPRHRWCPGIPRWTRASLSYPAVPCNSIKEIRGAL